MYIIAIHFFLDSHTAQTYSMHIKKELSIKTIINY